MSHAIHENHAHIHGPDCGHVAVKHGDHCDNHGPLQVV